MWVSCCGWVVGQEVRDTRCILKATATKAQEVIWQLHMGEMAGVIGDNQLST